MSSMREFTATTVLEPMQNGQIRPFLAEGIDGSGAKERIVIKTNKGYEDTSGDLMPMFTEAFCVLFARLIGLRAVEPVVVTIPSGLEYGALELREFENQRGIKVDYYDLIQCSHGKNLGTVFLGGDWKTLPEGKQFKAENRETANNIFTYDVMTQNTDRKADNPNLLMKDQELCLLDFDQAFGMDTRH